MCMNDKPVTFFTVCIDCDKIKLLIASEYRHKCECLSVSANFAQLNCVHIHMYK